MANLRTALEGKLTEKEHSVLNRSFDQIGDIAILEIPRELTKKQKIIANAVLTISNHIKCVYKKSGAHKGKFRVQKLIWLAGEKRTTTKHRESGADFELDTQTCYFSPRLVSERLRLANIIKPSENVLVIGAGVAPYPIIISKYSKAKTTGIEVNPSAVKYAEKNIKLNKLTDKVKMIKGDANKIKPKGFDRTIVMLPKTGTPLWKTALQSVKKGGIVHLYAFAPEENLHKEDNTVMEFCKKAKRTCKIINIAKAGQPSPRMFRICIDVVVL